MAERQKTENKQKNVPKARMVIKLISSIYFISNVTVGYYVEA